MVIKKARVYLTSIFLILGLIALSNQVLAVCPICTIAVIGGLGLSRWLGVDDTISGLWLGGFIVSAAIWLGNWLERKQFRFKFKHLTAAVSLYLIFFVILYAAGIVGHPGNKFCGIDKLVFGIIAGSLVFWAGIGLDKFLRNKNIRRLETKIASAGSEAVSDKKDRKTFFPFQKVVLPVSLLIILSIILYYCTKCGIIIK